MDSYASAMRNLCIVCAWYGMKGANMRALCAAYGPLTDCSNFSYDFMCFYARRVFSSEVCMVRKCNLCVSNFYVPVCAEYVLSM